MTKQYSWGIIGPGKIAKKFAGALKLAGNVTLSAVASRNKDRAKEFAQKYLCDTYYGTYGELVNDPAIDAVYIAIPHAFHAEHAVLCLQHGKAVLCEKPLALSAKQVASMIAASKLNNVFLMEAMWTRFLPLIELLGRVLDEGSIGEIKSVKADFGFKAIFDPASRLFDPKQGGGSLLDVGVYPLFLVMHLLGVPNKMEAVGKLTMSGVDEYCEATLFFNNGVSAMISSSLVKDTKLEAEIIGTEGTIKIPKAWYKGHKFLVHRTGEITKTIELPPVVNGFEYQIKEVVRCLEEGLIESPLMTHGFSLQMSTVMDEIRQQIGVIYPNQS